MKIERKSNIKKRAVALEYDLNKSDAPIITAKGSGFIAEEIIKRAKENNIPIQEDESLVEMLSQLQLNEKIPSSLYEVVAEIFAFIYRLDQEKMKKIEDSS